MGLLFGLDRIKPAVRLCEHVMDSSERQDVACCSKCGIDKVKLLEIREAELEAAIRSFLDGETGIAALRRVL